MLAVNDADDVLIGIDGQEGVVVWVRAKHVSAGESSEHALHACELHELVHIDEIFNVLV